jgi:hypothetical protein
LEGTLEAVRLEPKFSAENPWAAADCLIYAWYVHGRTPATSAKRYVYTEWDMLYRIPMHEFYKEVWNRDLAAADYFDHDRHWFWNWFQQITTLPPDIRKFAAGISPLAGTLMSDRLLRNITRRSIPRNVFCELRLATLAKASGFEIYQLPDDKSRNLTWNANYLRPIASPVYHPVKTMSQIVQCLSWEETHQTANAQVSSPTK